MSYIVVNYIEQQTKAKFQGQIIMLCYFPYNESEAMSFLVVVFGI